MKITYLIALIVLVVLGLNKDSNIPVHVLNENPIGKVPNDWFLRQRAFPFENINHSAYLSALEVAKDAIAKNANREEIEWVFEGPTNIEGRITDIEIQGGPQNIIFIGTANGGVFKRSVDSDFWDPIFDNESSLSIGDIAISSSNPEVIYVGTGEANAGGGSLAYDGVGIFKSINSGESWESVGLENSGSIGRMVINSTDPNIVYVAAMGRLFDDGSQGGVFKTTDGGHTWEQKLFISDSTGAIDIVIDNENPEIIYAAMWERVRKPGRRSYGGPTSGIFKSVDGGENWIELTNGLPTDASEKGRIGIDISASNTDVLYAVYADSIGYLQGIYKSMNAGESWINVTNGVDGAFSSFGWWFGRIKVDPTNQNIAYLIGLYIHKTTNGGSSWNEISGGQMHVDQHALAVDPTDNNKIYAGNDGGFFYSGNGGNYWGWTEDAPITQFYTCEVDEQHPERIYGGTQDNGTIRTMTGALSNWKRIYGGDGFRVLVDPEDNNYVYAEYQYGGLGRSTNGGESFSGATNGITWNDRFNWSCPYIFDPSDSQILYFGSNKLYKSSNRAQSWEAISNDLTNGDEGGNIAYNTLTTISVSPLNQDLIYTGSDDGNVWFTQDGGDSWMNISNDLPNRWVSSIVADPYDENVVFVTFSGYRWDEYLPHVFRSDNNGQTWIDISSNLPEAPVNELIADPDLENYLYLATDFGVYYSENRGENWLVAGTGIPIIVVNDIRLHNPSRKLVAATYGRGIYSLDLSVLTGVDNYENEVSTSLNCHPNPFSYSLEIEVPDKLKDRQIRVEIINSTGQIVDVVFEGIINNSIRNLNWDGTNQSGSNLPPGIYFVRLIDGNRTITEKVLLSNSK